MRVIHLTHGSGNGVDKACLMTATSMLIGKPNESDRTSCVCPVIAAFIRRSNDAMPEEILGEIYGDLMWEIAGTVTDSREVMQTRAYHFADVACRKLAPFSLRATGMLAEAESLEALSAISDKQSAVDAARWSATAVAAADAARWSATAVAAADAARWSAAADAAADAAREPWLICRQAIIDACKIGDRRPVECVLTREELRDALA